MRWIIVAALIPSLAFGLETIGEDYGSESMMEPESGKPFKIEFEYDNVFPAEFSDEAFKGNKLKYSEGTAEGTGIFYYNEAYNQGLALSVGYTHTHLGWKENPFFDQQNFNTVSIAITGWSNRVCNWLWQGQVAMNMDVNKYSFDYYTTWDFLLWGRYKFNDRIGIHAGFLALTGMKVDRFIPLFGFDWRVRKWKFNLIFPMNISAIYQWRPRWSFGVAGRFIFSRHRTTDEAPLNKAIFEYSMAGAEFAINYDYKDRILLNIHAGGTFGARLKITNRNHANGQHLDLNSSPYVGGKAVVKF